MCRSVFTRPQGMMRQQGMCGVYQQDVPQTTYSSEPCAYKRVCCTGREQLKTWLPIAGLDLHGIQGVLRGDVRAIIHNTKPSDWKPHLSTDKVQTETGNS